MTETSEKKTNCEEAAEFEPTHGISLEQLQVEQMQLEQIPWAFRNFGDEQSVTKAMEPLIGAVEELGELAHSVLKLKQGIRLDEDHHAKGQDAVGDTIVYLADLCTRMGWNFQRCVDDAWNEVKRRDWNKHRAEHGRDDRNNG